MTRNGVESTGLVAVAWLRGSIVSQHQLSHHVMLLMREASQPCCMDTIASLQFEQ